MKKLIFFFAGLIFTGFLAVNAYAEDELPCKQLANTRWLDTADTQLSALSLTFRQLGWPYPKGDVDSDLEYCRGNIHFPMYIPNCTKQPDGSLKIVLAYQDHRDYGYLILQSDGDNRLTVLPGSYLMDCYGGRTTIKGPFLRTN
jgi:hypothetical protein